MKVFIAHSAKDKPVVKLLLDRLTGPASLIDEWYDEAALAQGDIKEALQKGIWSLTDFTLAFFSASALQSDWFVYEIKSACERQRQENRPVVLPVVVDPDLSNERCWPILGGGEYLILDGRRHTESQIQVLSLEIYKQLVHMALQWIAALQINSQPPELTPRDRWRRRKDISAAEWQNIFEGARRRIWLLGHSMALAVDYDYSGRILAERVRNGVDVRLIVLDPFQTGAQLTEISGQLNAVSLADKIRKTLRGARAVETTAVRAWNADRLTQGGLAGTGQPPSLKVGLAQAIIHSSIVIVDDRFLVTPYSHNDEMGDQGALLDLLQTHRAHRELCDCFENDFRWHWQRSRAFVDLAEPLPRIELRVLGQREMAADSFSWYEGRSQDPPLPHVVVIFPTYRCTYGSRKESLEGSNGEFTKLLCPNCMYGPRLNHPQVEDMPVEQLEILLRDLVALGIPIVEISGGGEPLHHPDAVKVLASVRDARQYSDKTRFGLLANIHSLGKCKLEDDVLRSFSYVRWTWPEDAELTFLREEYIRHLRGFVERRSALDVPIRIGVKVLVSKRNVAGGDVECPVVTLVRDLFDAGVDHVKVRALRSPGNSPGSDDLRKLEDLLCRELSQLRIRGVVIDEKTLEVDVKERFVASDYKCRLSTMISVVDPRGGLRMCWNDVGDARRVIGNVFADGFLQTWKSEAHREICRRMDPARVCNSDHGCHCRIVGYQEVAVRALGSVSISQEVEIKADGFL